MAIAAITINSNDVILKLRSMFLGFFNAVSIMIVAAIIIVENKVFLVNDIINASRINARYLFTFGTYIIAYIISKALHIGSNSGKPIILLSMLAPPTFSIRLPFTPIQS